jgi:ankyrin repeat protein
VTALHRAAYFGRVPVIEALLNVGADINLADSEGMTPLHKAAENGHAAAVKYLLSRGADIHAKNILGMTPLQCAIEKGRKEIVEILKAAANKHDKTTHAGRLVAASPSATAALDLLKLKEPQQFNSAMVSTVKRSGESVVGVKRSRSELHAETASTKVDYSAGPSV